MGNNYKNKSTHRFWEGPIIPEFDLEYDFSKYISLVKDDFKVVKKFFPLLKLTILPTTVPKEIFMKGKLIPYEILKKCDSDKDISRSSICIRAIYPSNFDENNIYVEDIYNVIDWSNIPEKHRHFRSYERIKALCTHSEYGKINSLANTEKSLAILLSAWKLYIQYKRFQRTKKWELKDLRHGYEGIKQLKQMGEYQGL